MNIEEKKKEFLNLPKKKKKKLIERLSKELSNTFNKIYWFNTTRINYFYRTYLSKKYKRNNFISLLCISRERVKKLELLFISIKEKTKYKNNIELLILIDKDEPMKNQYVELINKYKENFSIKLFIENFKKNTERVNFLASKSKGDILFNTNDDMHIVTNDWDNELNNEANKFSNDEGFCIWPDVDINKYKYLHCDFPIINRRWYEDLTYYLYPEFNHFFGDKWNCDISKINKNFLVTNKVKIKNIKREEMISENDKTFFRTQSSHKKDEEIYILNKEKLYTESKKINIKS